MTRNEKIARLPRDIRNQLNRRLQYGEPGNCLVEWLNSLPEARSARSPKDGESPFSEQDLSEWKATGHCDWLAQQAALEQVRQLSADVAELKQAGDGALTDTLAQFLSAQYVVAAKAAVRQAAGAAVDLKTLQALCNDAVALRRGDQNAGWLALEREKFAEARKSNLKKALDACHEEIRQWPDVQELFDAAFARLEERTKGTP
jgi:hypothetical protein